MSRKDPREARVETCPNREQHTDAPKGYTDWTQWAWNMSKTHKQVKCEGCGMYAIWIPKESK